MSIILENNFIKLALDEKTGAITELVNKKTSWNIIGQPKLAEGIKLLVPAGRLRNNQALSKDQILDNVIYKGDNSITLVWNSILCDKTGQMDISVNLDISLREEELSFEITIDNKSPYYVEEVWSPYFGGIKPSPDSGALVSKMLRMCGEWHNIWLDDGFYQGCGYHGVDNPTIVRTFPGTEGVAPFSLFTNGTDGLYVGVHDIEPNVINFVHQLKPGYVDSMRSRISRTDEIDGRPAGFTVGVARMPYIMPGEKKTLAPVVLSFFEGDWHKGVKPYKKWRDTWFKRVSIPKWAEEMDCWMTLHINSPEGCCRYRYSELPDIAREAKKYGVQALQLIGWAIGGQDGNEPYQDTDPLLGTRNELKNAIKEIEKIGIRVLLMCKFKWCDWEIPEYETELYKHTIKDIYGKPFQFGGYCYQTLAQHLGLSERSGAGLCHSSTEYRKFALKEFDKILDLKPSGILYDELSNHMTICYDENHDHRFGECNHVGSVKLAREFYEHAVKISQDFLFTGEGPLDVFTQYYTVNYIRSFSMYYDPAHKYMDPDMKFATCLVGFDDREMVNQCVTYGYIINYEPFNFKGRMSDIPKTAEYGMLAQKLRRKLYDYIWAGTFMHTDDAELKVLNENREYIYSVFKNKKNGKRAVVIANQNIDRELQASIALSDSSNKFTVYSIENDETCDYNNLVEIKPRSLAVLVEV